MPARRSPLAHTPCGGFLFLLTLLLKGPLGNDALGSRLRYVPLSLIIMASGTSASFR